MTSSSRRKRRITGSSETSPDPWSVVRDPAIQPGGSSITIRRQSSPSCCIRTDPRPGRCSGPSLCPFDRDDGASVGQLIETQPFDLRWFQSIQVDVLQGHRPSIFLNQGKGRARHVVGGCAEPFREPADERGFPRSQIAMQEHDVSLLQSSGKPLACDDSLVFAAGGDGF